MGRYRYARWDGTQDADLFTADDVMERIADDLLDDGDLRSALRRLMQRGAQFSSGRRMSGLQDLLERLRSRRTQELGRYNLGSIVQDIEQRLQEIVDQERAGIRERLGETEPNQPPGSGGEGSQADDTGARSKGPAPGSSDPMFREILEGLTRKRLEQLDHLPPDVGGRIKELRAYDFMDSQARQKFEELLQQLQQQVLQSTFQGLQQSIQALTPESMRQIQQMVHDLNTLLEQRTRGEEPDFEAFMKKWGHLFPEDIKNLDQLVEHMQRQIAHMQALLSSMTPEMQQALQEMMQSAFTDDQLNREMARLARNLNQLQPGRGAPDEWSFTGDEPVSLQEAMRLMGDLSGIDQMERELIQALRTNDASSLDADEIGRLLGEEAARMLEQMQQLTRMLEEAGLIQKNGNEWELTPRALKKIGERALQDIFGSLRNDAMGDHALERNGVGIERLEDTKPFTYGDPFSIDAQRTVMNALRRHGPGTPVPLTQDDFEVYQTMAVTDCSTVIMLDMSYSMMAGGRFQAGRKVALALDSLIRSRFPRDNLYVVAFSYFVLTLRPEMLLESRWVEYGGGTNFQEALRQARQVLSKHKAGTRQIIMITDGQPTTYNAWSGRQDNGSGPSYVSGGAVRETLREVVRCTRENITINTFMMERDRSLSDFVRLMAKVNRGRAFFATPQRLGEYILVDYVQNKRKIIH